jgi:dihydrolipoamide dehydrogenase
VKFDAVIIGSGIGGYPAAAYLADKGLKVAVIEEHLVGGECTNYGCVPTKALYHFAESSRFIQKIGGRVEYSWASLVEWIKEIVRESREGIEYLLSVRDVTVIKGRGLLADPKRVIVESNQGKMSVESNSIILALGTDPVDIPTARFDGEGVISNREALFLSEKPNRVLVIGGGVVGVELANAYSSLGVDVTVVELMEHILPFTDRDVALAVKTHLSHRGVRVLEKTSVVEVSKKNSIYTAKLTSGEVVEVDKVIVAVGRKPRTSSVGLEQLGVRINEKGYIAVEDKMETSVKGIYAAGDVVGGPLLAHKALLESLIAARSILGEETFKLDYKLVPITIFTGLEVASLGYTERELNSLGVKYVKYRVPVYFLSAVKIKGQKNSFVKILMDEKSDRVLGVHIVAPNASEVVSAYIPLYLSKLNVKDAAKTPYPHLTVSESLRDVAEYILGEPVHIVIRK